jgi:diguanylate cyclase (GGDEF)-like protein
MNERAQSGPVPAIPAEALRDILDSCSDGVCVVVPEPLRLVFANRALRNRLGIDSLPWEGQTLVDVLPALSSAQAGEQLDRVLHGEVNEAVLMGELGPTGSGPMEIRLRRVSVDRRTAVAIIVRQAAAPLSTPGSDVDSLTGLASRSFLLSRLDELLRGGRATDEQTAVLFIDLDDFKWVNDTYGHLVGDRALCEVARRLATCIRTGDHIARFGGDEFVVLLERVQRTEEIQPVLDRIHAALRRPVALPAGDAIISASIGVAEASPAHRTAEDLLAAADLAMYASKRQ